MVARGQPSGTASRVGGTWTHSFLWPRWEGVGWRRRLCESGMRRRGAREAGRLAGGRSLSGGHCRGPGVSSGRKRGCLSPALGGRGACGGLYFPSALLPATLSKSPPRNQEQNSNPFPVVISRLSDWPQAHHLYLVLLLQLCTWKGNCERGSNCHPYLSSFALLIRDPVSHLPPPP